MKITAIARSDRNLEDKLNELSNACGNAGSIIAKDAIKNGGKTNIDINTLLLATDNTPGACAIFDNFILLDSTTQEPLIHSLLKKYASNI